MSDVLKGMTLTLLILVVVFVYFRSVRAVRAALNCIKKAMRMLHLNSRPKVVLVSDSPSLVKATTPDLSDFAEVIQSDCPIIKPTACLQTFVFLDILCLSI